MTDSQNNSEPVLKITVPDIEADLRLDIFCTHKIEGFSRSFFTKLAASDNITINGKIAKASHKVKTGEQVVIRMASPPPIEATPEDIPLTIAYEDEHLLIIDKPAGMVCHPAAGNYAGTMINGLLHYFTSLKDFSDKLRPGLVHRLDKDTSGLLVVAKTEQTLAKLQTALRARDIERIYTAIVWGKMPSVKGEIDLPLGRSREDRKKIKVFGQGQREALTYYEVQKKYPMGELLRIRLGTGRTHQIRVHLSYFGNPVMGDPTYGGRAKAVQKFSGKNRQIGAQILGAISRQALHASQLSFVHPMTGKELSFSSPLPADIQLVLNILESL
jgi:23S rRNA pseudouridine1911/1915/1917 synthase